MTQPQLRPEIRPEPDGHIELSAQRARQGVTGHNVRYVLVFGILAVVIAFAALYLSFFV